MPRDSAPLITRAPSLGLDANAHRDRGRLVLAGGSNPRLVRRLGAVAMMLWGALLGALLLHRGLAWPFFGAAAVDVVALAGVASTPSATSS